MRKKVVISNSLLIKIKRSDNETIMNRLLNSDQVLSNVYDSTNKELRVGAVFGGLATDPPVVAIDRNGKIVEPIYFNSSGRLIKKAVVQNG